MPKISLPPPPPTFDAQEFRRRLAGLSDPNRSAATPISSAEFREAAKTLCVILARLYGKTLARVKLWDRIDGALLTASAKIQDGDMDRLITVCLDHVKSESIVYGPLEPFMRMLNDRPPEWRQGFVRYLGTSHSAATIHGRLAWESVKAKSLLRVTLYGEIMEFGAKDVLDAEQAAQLADSAAELDAAEVAQ